jgi:hypothetical protein
MAQTIKASALDDHQRRYGQIFIDDAEPQHGLDGQPTHFARRVVTTTDHYDSQLGRQITVKFADGTPGRFFNLDDDVVVYSILPGTDLTAR